MEPRNETVKSTNQLNSEVLSNLKPPKPDRKTELARKKAETAQLAETALADLQAAIAQGQPKPLKDLLATMSRFHNYSLRNLMLIVAQKPEATKVAGFRTWKQLGRNVIKGEKGIRILAPLIRKKIDTVHTPAAISQSQDTELCGFRIVHVFDLSQTDGKPLPTLSEIHGDPGKHLLGLKNLVGKQGIELTYADLRGPEGISKGGSIVIDSRLTPTEEFSVLAHELAHEMLHHGAEKGKQSKQLVETEAESVAYVVCHAFGIDTRDRTNEYIQLYKGNSEVLANSLTSIRKTASKIITGLAESSD